MADSVSSRSGSPSGSDRLASRELLAADDSRSFVSDAVDSDALEGSSSLPPSAPTTPAGAGVSNPATQATVGIRSRSLDVERQDAAADDADDSKSFVSDAVESDVCDESDAQPSVSGSPANARPPVAPLRGSGLSSRSSAGSFDDRRLQDVASSPLSGPHSPPSSRLSEAGTPQSTPHSRPSNHDLDVPYVSITKPVTPTAQIGVRATGPNPTSPTGLRPPAMLDVPSCGLNSARSSQLSEVSEDFRSDWGAPSPLQSARSITGGSLEISASVDTVVTGRLHSHALGDKLSGAGVFCHTVTEEASTPVGERQGNGASFAGSWQALQSKLDVLGSLLTRAQEVRTKQREHLRRLQCGA